MTAPADGGLQPERTALAWRRTVLLVVVVALVVLRSAWQQGTWPALVLTLLAMLMALVAAVSNGLGTRWQRSPAAAAGWLAGAIVGLGTAEFLLLITRWNQLS